MPYFTGIGLKVKNYRCFTGDEFQGIDDIKHINVIIGKNNAGKSAFMGFMREFVTKRQVVPSKREPFLLEVELTRSFNPDLPLEESVYGHFSENLTRLDKATFHSQYDLENDPETLHWNLVKAPDTQTPFLKPFMHYLGSFPKGLGTYSINADRDIIAENNPNVSWRPNGSGATSLYRKILTDPFINDYTVKSNILESLNFIFSSEASFQDFSVKGKDTISHEIYLVEKGSNKEIPISKMGSGIKTALLVIASTQLIEHVDYWDSPKVPSNDPSDGIFFFEELENNLHPTIQRRLFRYLYDFSHNHHCPIFLSTHSSTAIEFFHNDPDAQIIQVQRQNGVSTISTVRNLQDSHGLLDDLGVRASDLLQSNCVVWVEGPSDRIYFNHWMKLISNDEVQEGLQYQCLFYGGRLRSHLDALPTDENLNDLIKLININRNFVFITDSDVKAAGGELDGTKKRLEDECRKAKARFWATEGREIENYIPKSVLMKVYGEGVGDREIDVYESIGEYLKAISGADRDLKDRETKPVLKDKVAFAKKMCEKMEKEDIKAGSDLEIKLNEMWKYIKRCNEG